jgi:hypothetical protein
VGLDSEDIERIAERVVTLLAEAQREPVATSARFVDATTIAQLLDVDRDWVYAHAEQLGAIRLGGERGRLRFDLATLEQRFERVGSTPIRSASRASGRGRRAPRRAPLIPYAQQSAPGSEKVA